MTQAKLTTLVSTSLVMMILSLSSFTHASDSYNLSLLKLEGFMNKCAMQSVEKAHSYNIAPAQKAKAAQAISSSVKRYLATTEQTLIRSNVNAVLFKLCVNKAIDNGCTTQIAASPQLPESCQAVVENK